MNRLGACAGVLGGVGVAVGAFGAHALDGRLSARGETLWETATFYLLVHAVAGLCLALQRGFERSAALMLVGGLVFALTLYALALGGPSWLGAVTPVGGILMIGGWIMVVIAALRKS